MPQLAGIDVSHYQNENTQPKKIDWQQVKNARVQFCIIKASDNKSGDRFYAANRKGTQEAEILSGAYHFMRITASAADQAQAFLKSAKLSPGLLLPSLDVEVLPKTADGRRAFVDKIVAWLGIVSDAIGNKKPFIYTRKSVWDLLTKQKAFGDYPLWVANYGVSNPKLPASWERYVIWQYSEAGSVPGIKKNVDLNALAGTFADLKSNYTI